MENKSHALAAGTFVVALVALLVVLASWLTRDNSEQRIYELSSKEGVTGLQPQAGVRYKGVSVGRVTAIELDRATPGNVLVRIAVTVAAPITQSTFATLGYQGVTGLAFVQLDDPGTSTQALTTSLENVARIPMRPGLVTRLSEQGTNLLTQLELASQRVNSLLAAENQHSLMLAINNLGKAAHGIGQLAKSAERMDLPQLAQDATTSLKAMKDSADRLGASADGMKFSAAEFRRVTARMNEPGGTLDKIADGATALVATGSSLNSSVVPRLSRAVDETSRAVRSLGRVADSVGENPQSLLLGKGAQQAGPGEVGFVAPPSLNSP
jgi:phospholipid/cholesterol/gamma-HCH transport system substrate-binding protein